jgi:hypothetical protein
MKRLWSTCHFCVICNNMILPNHDTVPNSKWMTELGKIKKKHHVRIFGLLIPIVLITKIREVWEGRIWWHTCCAHGVILCSTWSVTHISTRHQWCPAQHCLKPVASATVDIYWGRNSEHSEQFNILNFVTLHFLICLWFKYERKVVDSFVVIKICCYVFKNVAKVLKKVRPEMWFVGKIELFNAEVVWNNVLLLWLSVSVQNYRIIICFHAYTFRDFSAW